jgi:hypothetical protein
MPGEGMEAGGELDLARQPVVPADQPAIVVQKHLSGTPPKWRKALSRPANQLSCRSFRNTRTCSRRE